jgi:hypothetical protein
MKNKTMQNDYLFDSYSNSYNAHDNVICQSQYQSLK